MNTIICDIDGVLSDNSHRQHLLENKDDKERWNRFFNACGEDEPIKEIFKLIIELEAKSFNIVLLTSRPESVRGITEDWFLNNFHSLSVYEKRFHFDLIMRPNGDYRKDHVLKPILLEEYLNRQGMDKHDILFILEDNPKNIKAFRELGYRAFEAMPITY